MLRARALVPSPSGSHGRVSERLLLLRKFETEPSEIREASHLMVSCSCVSYEERFSCHPRTDVVAEPDPEHEASYEAVRAFISQKTPLLAVLENTKGIKIHVCRNSE